MINQIIINNLLDIKNSLLITSFSFFSYKQSLFVLLLSFQQPFSSVFFIRFDTIENRKWMNKNLAHLFWHIFRNVLTVLFFLEQIYIYICNMNRTFSDKYSCFSSRIGRLFAYRKNRHLYLERFVCHTCRFNQESLENHILTDIINECM